MLKHKIKMEESQRIIQAIIDQIPDPILYIQPDYTVSLMNKAANNLNPSVSISDGVKCYNLIHYLQFPCTKDTTNCPLDLVRSTKTPSVSRQTWIDKNGDTCHVETHISPMLDTDGSIVGYLEVMHDITEQLSQVYQLTQEALHDPLTKLPNRRLLSDRINQAIEHKSRSGETFGVFFIDLDHFKKVNDTLGHLCGDNLLIEVAKRLRKVCRKGDTVSRIGGDEFVLIVENGVSNTHFMTVAAKIQALFNDPFFINEEKILSGCSIGVSVFPQDGNTTEALLHNADIAMYISKNAGRNQFHFFSSDMTQQAYAYLEMGMKLKTAINNEEFNLHYQPIYNIHTKKYASIEIFIRWNHPEEGLISASKFLPTAKKAGLMKEIDFWVIKKGFETYELLLSRNIAPDTLSLNLTTETLLLPEFLSTLKKLLISSCIEPCRIVFELMESQLLENTTASKRVIQELHALGVKVALDNFGIGNSSFVYLIDCAIDTLKIDQSLIHNFDIKDSLLVKSIISMSSVIGFQIVAQGVENTQHQLVLNEYGIDLFQGYAIAKPMNVDNLIHFLENNIYKRV